MNNYIMLSAKVLLVFCAFLLISQLVYKREMVAQEEVKTTITTKEIFKKMCRPVKEDDLLDLISLTNYRYIANYHMVA